MMKIVINHNGYTEEIVDQIEGFILAKKVVIMPSDTIYGFLAHPDCQDRVREIKKRDPKPFLNLIHSIEQLKNFNIDSGKFPVLKYYWPGPFTFLVPVQDGGKSGFRVPDWPVLQHLTCRGPLLSTSVNFSGNAPLNDPSLIEKEFDGLADLLVYDELTPQTVHSTIVDLSTEPYQIIRKGEKSFIWPLSNQ